MSARETHKRIAAMSVDALEEMRQAGEKPRRVVDDDDDEDVGNTMSWLEQMQAKYDVTDNEKLESVLCFEDLCTAYSLKPHTVKYIPYGEKTPREFTIHASTSRGGLSPYIYVKDVIRMVFERSPKLNDFLSYFDGIRRCALAHCMDIKEAWYPSGTRHLSVMQYDPEEYTHFIKQGGTKLLINQLKGTQSDADFMASVMKPICELKTMWNDHLKSHAVLNNPELFETLIKLIRIELNGVSD